MLIRNPKSEELTQILSELNTEFIFSKGKKLTIEKRYPLLFENLEHLWGLFDNGYFLAFLAVKPVLLKISNEVIQGFFVGSVFTPTIHRKKGYGKSLLRYIQEKYIKNNYKFGVLWTNLHEYYENMGWIAYENGCYIKCSNAKTINDIKTAGNSVIEFNKNDYKGIDKYRVDIEENHIVRKHNNVYYGYGSVYSPGEMPLSLKVIRGDSLVGYAVGVMNQNSIIIYEILENDEEVLPLILKYLIGKYNKVEKFNFNLDSNSHRINDLNNWFDNVIITKPNITMYYCPDIKVFKLIRNFYFPFLDRI
jgi:hypothetical protein